MIRGLLDQCADLPKNMSETFKVYISVWLLVCVVCTCAYTSKMVSLLTFPSFDVAPSNFDELADANDYHIDFLYFGNVGYTLFEKSTNPSFVKIFTKMTREPDALACLKHPLVAIKTVCITFSITYQQVLYRNLSDQYGRSPLTFLFQNSAMFPAGLVHQHWAPFSSNFKSILYSAMETGLIPFWQQQDLNEILERKNHWQKANNITINDAAWGSGAQDDDNLLRVRNLTGAFTIMVVGMTAAMFAFGVENMKRCRSNRLGLSSLYISARFGK